MNCAMMMLVRMRMVDSSRELMSSLMKKMKMKKKEDGQERQAWELIVGSANLILG